MPTKWRKLPGDDSQEQILETEWTGPGWYITTRKFPGSEIYKTWQVGSDHGNMADPSQRDKAGRSLGGSIRYLEEQPAQ